MTIKATFRSIVKILALALSLNTPAFAQNAPAANPNAVVAAAIIAATASIVCALLSFAALIFNEFRRRANDRKIAAFNAELQEKLVGLKRRSDEEIARLTAAIKLQSDLQLAAFSKSEEERLSAASARRAYEYDARRRLYQECEPLLFQLSQNAGVAIGRVISLAREAREGRLVASTGALSGELMEDSGRGYYIRSTLFQLLAPLAIAYLLRTQLTHRDLTLDPWVKRAFALSDASYRAFTRDFQFAALDPAIPDYRNRADSSANSGVIKQGVFLGRLDNLMEALIDVEGEKRRIITFGQFEKTLALPNSTLLRALAPLTKIIANFHPGTHPVFWRILCAEYFLFRALRLNTRKELEDGSPDRAKTELEPITDDLCWKNVMDAEVEASMRIGWEYLMRSLPN